MNTAAAEHPVRARLGLWPYDPDVAHLVLLDHHMVPDARHVTDWVAESRRRGARMIRTGALFPPSRPAFRDAGFSTIDTLTLLAADLTTPRQATNRMSTPRPQRLRQPMLEDAAAVDARAFAALWRNDAPALADIVTATPHHRARCLQLDGRLVAFAISGRAAAAGYIQRLAVDPSAQRRGLGRILVDDALRWMRRRGVTHVLVNTAVDNTAANHLYRTSGFQEQPERLEILELHLGET